MNPQKASIISLLTISEDTEKVFFIYCKEINDLPPVNIFWYQNKGMNGEAEFIWPEKKIKQWVAIASEEKIKLLWKELVTNEEVEYRFKKKLIKFSVPKLEMKTNEEDFVKIKDVCLCGRNEYPDLYTSKRSITDVTFLIEEDNNCAFIEGYDHHPLIKPLFPPGLLPKTYLAKYLKEKIFAIYKSRGIYWELRGNRVSPENDPTSFVGFIHETPEFRRGHQVCVRDLSGLSIIGVADIDPNTGKWEMKLAKPTGRGQFLLIDKHTQNIICGEKFYLIKDINFQAHIVHTVLTDLFDRKITISEKEVTTPKTSIVWDALLAPDTKQSQMELSDKLTDVLMSFGSKIVFNDPYLWGDIRVENDEIVLSTSQKIFLNALITAIAKGKIQELIIIGYWKSAKKMIKGDKSSLKEKYLKFYNIIQNTFKNSSLNKVNKFELVLSDELFHDRYWMGNEVIFHVSNSINGSFESSELKIVKEEGSGKDKIESRINRRYNNGEIISLIS